VVHQGRDSISLEPVAVKEIDLTVPTASTLYKNEVRALGRLPPHHKNLPTLIGNCKTSLSAQIVMSYFPYPTLQSLIEKRGAFSELEALFILRQIVRHLFS